MVTCKMWEMHSDVEERTSWDARDWDSCPSLPPGTQLCGVGQISFLLAPQFPIQITFKASCQPGFSFMPHVHCGSSGGLFLCPLAPGLRLMEQPPSPLLQTAMAEGKSALERLLLAISRPGSDLLHVLSPFTGWTQSCGQKVQWSRVLGVW